MSDERFQSSVSAGTEAWRFSGISFGEQQSVTSRWKTHHWLVLFLGLGWCQQHHCGYVAIGNASSFGKQGKWLTLSADRRVWFVLLWKNLALAFLQTTVLSAESFPLKESNRLIGPVLLWPRPKRCLTLSTHAIWWSWMVFCPDFTLQMIMRSSGWHTLEGEPAYKRRRMKTLNTTIENQLNWRFKLNLRFKWVVQTLGTSQE